MKENTILELKDVHKYFKDNNGKILRILKNINITLKKGECIGIVGESGCGKSTLARIISHLTVVSKGKILFKNEDITTLHRESRKNYYKNVQMIFQDPLGTFSPRMKIGEYLMEPFINFKLMNKKKAHTYAQELLNMVGLSKEDMKKYPNELSGGQLQRVVITRAIGIKPDIIICDECTSALDVSIQKQIINLLLQLKKKTDFSSIFITHDLALAENICDKIYVMYLGEIVEVIEKQNIVKEAKHPYTKMLLNSVFSIKNLNKKMNINQVKMKNIENIEGCVFAPCCQSASPKCFEEKSTLRKIDETSSVACSLY